MPEMKYRRIETVTEELYNQGRWFWVTNNGGSTYASPGKTHFLDFENIANRHALYGQVLGPIPEPPKPPPPIYRFEATFEGERVSGIYVPDEVSAPKSLLIWYHNCGLGCKSLNDLTDIHWLDTPPEGVE